MVSDRIYLQRRQKVANNTMLARERGFLPFLAFVAILLTMTLLTCQLPRIVAFQPSHHSSIPRTRRQPRHNDSGAWSYKRRSKSKMSIEEISEFYQTYPVQSAVLTMGVKASLADVIAQVKSWTKEGENLVSLQRNAAYVIYGGIYVGPMCHLEYDCLFPLLFGAANEHHASLQTVAQECIFDNFVSAPTIWLPPIYLIKALFFEGESIEAGLQNYVDDIRYKGLLWKYWSVWVPAQCVTFSVVPEHFRVAFMACVSFLWFILLSLVSSSSSSPQELSGDMVTQAEVKA